MGVVLHVNNLPFGITTFDLNDFFGIHGKVLRAIVISDKLSGVSKGYGFVEMANETEAKQAISFLDNKEIAGRNISVSLAKSQTWPHNAIDN